MSRSNYFLFLQQLKMDELNKRGSFLELYLFGYLIKDLPNKQV